MLDNVCGAGGCGPMNEEWGDVPAERVASRAECLIQLLAAYRDIADFDDIHQAMERLGAVKDWIRREAQAAAADPLFAAEPETVTV
ncbi:MAG: hypothetical protein ACREFD_08195 [Stellaceae bacterium]